MVQIELIIIIMIIIIIIIIPELVIIYKKKPELVLLMDFLVLADHREKIKESDKKNKDLNLPKN